MSIDTKNIEEVTFTQSFRGYNSDEVDDFLDDIYDETLLANKEIEQLQIRIKELEGIKNQAHDFNDDSTNIIANAQITADEIIAKANKKAQSMIDSVQNIKDASNISDGIDNKSVNKLKMMLRQMYEKQMEMLENISDNKTVSEPAARQIQRPNLEPELKNLQHEPINKSPRKQPSITFAGLINDSKEQAAADKASQKKENTEVPLNLYNEINAIGINGFGNQSIPSMPAPAQNIEIQEPSPIVEEEFKENKPESPDDIIAQILRDNNRN